MNGLTDAAGNPIALPSRAVWEARRAEVLAAMQEVMGPLPGTEKRVPPDVRLREEVDCGSYVRRLIDYASEPGGRVPAYLLIPKGQGPFPAVLCLHPTDDVVGHGVVVGLGGKANRAYASELAERVLGMLPGERARARWNLCLKRDERMLLLRLTRVTED